MVVDPDGAVLRALRPQDRVAVKPHASPVFHAIQYLMGNRLEKLQNFRGFGGVQSYPVAHQGRGRRGFLDRLGGTGRGDHVVRLARAGLHRGEDPGRRGCRWGAWWR